MKDKIITGIFLIAISILAASAYKFQEDDYVIQDDTGGNPNRPIMNKKKPIIIKITVKPTTAEPKKTTKKVEAKPAKTTEGLSTNTGKLDEDAAKKIEEFFRPETTEETEDDPITESAPIANKKPNLKLGQKNIFSGKETLMSKAPTVQFVKHSFGAFGFGVGKPLF